MSALLLHRDTLQTLRLEPEDHKESLDQTYEHLDGFRQLHALKELSTAWSRLMGRSSNRWYQGAGDWQCPQMRDVLPSRSRTLSFFTKDCMISFENEDSYALLLVDTANDLPLKRVSLEYQEDDNPSDLPFNSGLIEQAYRERGVQLDTKLPVYDGKSRSS